MADERTGIKYIGKEPYYKDRIFGTGLVWKSGEALPLAVEVAKEFLKHPTLFQEVKGLTPLMASTSSSGGGWKWLGSDCCTYATNCRGRACNAV